MFKAFAEFAVKGNMMDMAVGIVLGAAFGTVVKSLVDDIILPPIGLALGGVDFSNFKVVLQEATEDDDEVAIRYGLFINSIIAFLIIAFALFLIVMMVTSAKKRMEKQQEEEKAAETSKEEALLQDIRDILAKSSGVKLEKDETAPDDSDDGRSM